MLDTAGGSTSAPEGEAAIPASPSPHVVHLACPCPGHPHAFDAVTLREHVSNRMGVAVATMFGRHPGDEMAISAELGMIFLRYGITAWTFTDADGPVAVPDPVPEALVEQWLPFGRGGMTVLDAAADLYRDEAFAPFQVRSSPPSPGTLAAPTTSARNGSGPTHRKPSSRSSRTGSGGKRSGR